MNLATLVPILYQIQVILPLQHALTQPQQSPTQPLDAHRSVYANIEPPDSAGRMLCGLTFAADQRLRPFNERARLDDTPIFSV